MKFCRTVTLVMVLAAVLSAIPATAKDAPATADELAKQFEHALKTKSKAAAMALFDWDGVSSQMKAKQEAMFNILFAEDEQVVKSVTLGPVPSGFPLEQIQNGVHYHPNVTVMGVVNVKYDNDDNPTEAMFTYGKKDKAFYLAALVESKP